MNGDALSRLLVALAVTELVHNRFEVWGMAQKVLWLERRLRKRPIGRWPINIDRPWKTIVLHLLLLVVVGAIVWVTLGQLGNQRQRLAAAAILLLINYGLTTAQVDRFHRQIGRLLRSIN